MSPPPMDATRCQPKARERTVTAISKLMSGVITYQTVRATNPTNAPTFRKFLPGSISGLDEIFAESFRFATIEPVKVTPPMKIPIKTSAW